MYPVIPKAKTPIDIKTIGNASIFLLTRFLDVLSTYPRPVSNLFILSDNPFVPPLITFVILVIVSKLFFSLIGLLKSNLSANVFKLALFQNQRS